MTQSAHTPHHLRDMYETYRCISALQKRTTPYFPLVTKLLKTISESLAKLDDDSFTLKSTWQILNELSYTFLYHWYLIFTSYCIRDSLYLKDFRFFYFQCFLVHSLFEFHDVYAYQLCTVFEDTAVDVLKRPKPTVSVCLSTLWLLDCVTVTQPQTHQFLLTEIFRNSSQIYRLIHICRGLFSFHFFSLNLLTTVKIHNVTRFIF